MNNHGIRWYLLTVFILAAAGQWARGQCELTPPITLTPSDGLPGDSFGQNALAIEGDHVFVGASSHDSTGVNGSGAVYVYRRADGVWAEVQKLIPSDPVVNGGFGYAIDLQSNTLVVGAPSAAGIEPGSGAVYVFEFDGSTWFERQKIIGSESDATSWFGNSVALHSSTLIVGTPRELVPDPLGGDPIRCGAVYVFKKIGSSWPEQQKLVEPTPDEFQGFGWSCAIDSGRMAIAATVGGVFGPGIVYEAYPGSTDWEIRSELVLSNHPYVDFGTALCFLGQRLFASAPSRFYGGAPWPGAVYAFDESPARWSLPVVIQPGDAADRDGFGVGISCESDFIAVGAPYDDDQAAGAGSVYLLRPENNTWRQSRKIHAAAPAANGVFGSALASTASLIVVGGDEFVTVLAPEDDCNGNGLADECETSSGISPDCNYNSIPDDCESDDDCDGNGVVDICDIDTGAADDCNENGLSDACEPLDDCDTNGVRDVCQITPAVDCQQNGQLDTCDITSGLSFDDDGDDVPDECQCPACYPLASPGRPCVRLVAVTVNGNSITPTQELTVRPGDSLEAEVRVSCWGHFLGVVQTFQAAYYGELGATSGESGLVLPRGWDAPLIRDNCPCTDPTYPICNPSYGCVGPEHAPALGAYLQEFRPDFLLAGLSNFSAVDVSSLGIRWGGTVDGPDAAFDVGHDRYIGTLSLIATPDASGTFVLGFFNYFNQTFLADAQANPYVTTLATKPLTLHVQCLDDLFCNGMEELEDTVGCISGKPPSCNDGVACTIDSCDEIADDCAHALNHDACDDGNVCTRDECTPAGCTNIDDQCGDIPTTSNWGLAVLALCLLIAAKVGMPDRRTS